LRKFRCELFCVFGSYTLWYEGPNDPKLTEEKGRFFSYI
jgi:hypothetical protein